MKRQLTSVLYADAAGYTRLTGLDEELTHRQLDAGLDLLTSMVEEHEGRKIHEAAVGTPDPEDWKHYVSGALTANVSSGDNNE